MTQLFSFPPKPFGLERQLRQSGFPRVCGIDEVGRGALAGPVVAAAVILDTEKCSVADQIEDSKKLSPQERERLSEIIQSEAVGVGIGMIHHDVIDQINILQATFRAMIMALEQLSHQPDMCLVDGNSKIPSTLRQICVVDGDNRVTSIGAASIVAKVFRDQWMRNIASQYPHYLFEKNKGYGTKEHIDAISNNGFSVIHRRTFSLRNFQLR